MVEGWIMDFTSHLVSTLLDADIMSLTENTVGTEHMLSGSV